MTDRELMIYRFKHPHSGAAQLAEKLGMSRKEFIEAVERGLKEEQEDNKNGKEAFQMVD